MARVKGGFSSAIKPRISSVPIKIEGYERGVDIRWLRRAIGWDTHGSAQRFRCLTIRRFHSDHMAQSGQPSGQHSDSC
ncbi:hypothetical protein V6N11_049741 [Hibiscus sabdariffa]|uniref:Uncharacterized protein n=1 Tax=Hibiscus sabdariffa TaxID=183260 RepID=A0ABR2T7Z6_9ROSI